MVELENNFISDYLSNIYYDVNVPSGYSNINELKKRAKEDGIFISKKKIRDWLSNQRTYSLHFPVRKRFQRNKVKVFYIDQQWSADLSDLRSLSKDNDGYCYLCCVIDCFSRFAWVVPLKRKTGQSLINTFKKIFKESRRQCQVLNFDKGSEAVNQVFLNFLKSQNIKFFTSQNDTKAPIIERFQRTLKQYMWRYFTRHNTNRYIDVLDGLVSSYNNRYHRTIRMRPIDVTKKNELQVWRNIYGSEHVPVTKYKFKKDDFVRITKYKNIFSKGYKAGWSDEVFVIFERFPRHPPVYTIKDLAGEPIIGSFYDFELQKVTLSDAEKQTGVEERRNIKDRRINTYWEAKKFPKFEFE